MNSFQKAECAVCGQHIEFPADTAEQEIACPSCGAMVKVVREDIKAAPRTQPEPQPAPPSASAPVSPPGSPPAPQYRQVEESGVAVALSIIAGVELSAAPIVGLVVGSAESASLGWMILLSGLLSGVMFLGFARVIEHVYESAQRLRRIEFLLQRESDDKKGVNERR